MPGVAPTNINPSRKGVVHRQEAAEDRLADRLAGGLTGITDNDRGRVRRPSK